MKIDKCNKCDLNISRNNIVNGAGNTNKRGIMFIGEAPGYYEDKYAIPFIGNSGTLLNNILLLIGLKRNDIYITNIIKCRPPNNRSPLAREIKNCVPYLRQELLELNPIIIVLLGNTALNVFFNKYNLKVSNIRGYYIKNIDRVILTTFHPSYILRNKDNNTLLKQYINDFILIGKLYRELINPFITFKI